jgi:hypothetical protein
MRLSCYLITCTILSAVMSVGAESSGTVGGTAVFVSGTADSLHTVDYGSGVTFAVNCNGKRFEKTVDENGDFQISLPAGKCRLIRVEDEKHHELALEKKQVKVFSVRPNQHTRFDIMLRKSRD